ALLAERDPFRRTARSRDERDAAPVPPCDSDAIARVELVRAAARGGGPRSTPYGEISPSAARRLLQAADQVAAFARREIRRTPEAPQPPRAEEAEALGRALLAAFPDRLAKRRAPGEPRGVMVGTRGVRLGPESGVQRAELFLCLDL